MENLLQGITGVLIYIDDILITGKIVAEHLSTLGAVLERLEEAGVKLKRSKCSFLLLSVEFLGYRISGKGIQPAVEKVEVIHRAPEPSDVTQLKSFWELSTIMASFSLICRVCWPRCINSYRKT